MSKTTTPRRVYAVHHAGTGTTRLVRAVNAATAVRHVVRTDYTAEVASQDDLIDLLSAGTRVEDAPAADHVEDSRAMVEPLAAGGFAPCGRALGDCGRVTQTCGRDGCGAEVVEMPPQHAPIAAALKGLASCAQEPAAEQSGEPAGCPSAAPTAFESDGASSAVDDDGGRELTAAEQAANEAQGAARFERHHGGELKRQAEAAAARAGGKIVAKYRDPATGQTWSGRGLRPRWLVQAIEDGKTLDEFLVENQGARA